MNSARLGLPAIASRESSVRTHTFGTDGRPGGDRGITLVEAVISIAVIAIAMTAFMSGISFMRVQNRAASERILAATTAAQILEMFKSLPPGDIGVSDGSTIYLQGMGTSSPDTNWQVPTALSTSGGVVTSNTAAIPIEDTTLGSNGFPNAINNKLPNGYWQVVFTPVGTSSNVTQITVIVGWTVYPASTFPPSTYSISTMVNNTFPAI